GRLLQPILLKSSTAGAQLYEVVDGRRRFQALELMDRKELEESEYTFAAEELNGDVAAYIANTERKPLSPLEEARQICDMLKTMEAEEIAEKLGKTLHYVVSRSRLAELSGKWQQVLAEPEKYPQWTIGKLQMIAREPAETQEDIEHLIYRSQTITELWSSIQYYHRKLSTAPFKWQNVCRICQKRSDNQGVLFSEDETEATCLDKDCFEKQCLNAVKKKLQENPNLKVVRSSGGTYNREAEKFADKNKAPASWQMDYKEVTDPAEADAIVCCGDKIGKLVKLTKKTTAKTSADTAADRKAENAKKAEIKEKRKILRLAMTELVRQLKHIKHWDILVPPMQEAVWNTLLDTGIGGASLHQWKAKAVPKKESSDSFEDLLLQRFIAHVCWHIEYSITNSQLNTEDVFAEELCKAIGFTWQDFMNKAQKEYEQNKGKKK
ncbi:MAG: hypothetical protein IKD10_12155, partial [Lentisphaeria bacterium]|nr:hypothetical protein [Lentisphaeria bacterium]